MNGYACYDAQKHLNNVSFTKNSLNNTFHKSGVRDSKIRRCYYFAFIFKFFAILRSMMNEM